MEELGVVLGEAHPLARHEILDLPDLSDTVMKIWPRNSSPGYYDLATQSFVDAGFAGVISEYENHTREVHFGDTVTRMEMAACRAFSIAFSTQALDSGFVWRPVRPKTLVPLVMCWMPDPSPTTQQFLELAHSLAEASGWIEPSAASMSDA